MSFDIDNLNPIGGQSKPVSDISGGALGNGGPQMWSYVSEDALATCDGSGYFNDASSLLNPGDIIYVVVAASGAVSDAGWLVVLTNASGVVDTSNETAITLTDSD